MSMRAPDIKINLYMLSAIFISPYPVRNSLASSSISTFLTITSNRRSNPDSYLTVILNSLESLAIDLVLLRLKYKLLENSISSSSRDSEPCENDNAVGGALHERDWLLGNVIGWGTEGIVDIGYVLFGLIVGLAGLR